MTPRNGFTHEYDAVRLAFSVLKKLGSGKVNSFDERLRSQKIQYLAQTLGVSPSYPFGIYIHGPYSSGLANDLFKIDTEGIAIEENEPFTPEELKKKFSFLSSLVKGRPSRELELIATLHLMIKDRGDNQKTMQEFQKFKTPTKEEMIATRQAINQILEWDKK